MIFTRNLPEMLQLNNVSASYGDQLVLSAVSATFTKGQVTALVGPNGCGKSTLLKAVMGFVPLRDGAVELEGQKTTTMPRRALARRVAYLPQETYCPDYMTLGELIELAGYARYSLFGGPTAGDRALFAESLAFVGLADLAHHQVNLLSGGQRQRAWIAMVLAQDADIILLDEPVNHLDIKYQYAVLSLIRSLTVEHGKTVIIVLHDLNLTAAFADSVVMLKAGRVQANGTVQEAINPRSLAEVFGIEAEVFRHDNRLVCLPRCAPADVAGS